VRQYIYRTAYHTYNRKQTESRSKRYLDILEGLAVQANDSFDKTDGVDYVRAVQEARDRAETRQQNNLRNPFYQVDPTQLYEGDEHTNKFVENCIEKYVMYARTADAVATNSSRSGTSTTKTTKTTKATTSSSKTTRHTNSLGAATSTMSRADKLALRILQLTDSLYSSLLLRRCFIKYGISCLSKLRVKELQTDHASRGKGCHVDDAALDLLLQTPSLLNELANEAVICAEDIEYRILEEQDKIEGTQMAPADKLQWQNDPPSIYDDFADDYVTKIVPPAKEEVPLPKGKAKIPTNGPRIMYAKCRNHLLETTLRDPSYEDGFSAYLRDIVHEMLTNTKVRYCGRYSKKNKEEGVFWGYAFQEKVHDTDLIAPLHVRADEASIFGHRKKCDSKCTHHRFTEREWLYYYREAKEKAGATPKAKKQRRKAKKAKVAAAAAAAPKAASKSPNAPTGGSATNNRFKGLRGRRIYCPDCAQKHACNGFALQSGLMIRGQFEHALKLVRTKLLGLSTKGMAHVGSLPSELRTGTFGAQNGPNETLASVDREKLINGAIFAAAQANDTFQEMLASGAPPATIETARQEALHLARVADKERKLIMDAKLKEEKERFVGASRQSSGSHHDLRAGAATGAQFQTTRNAASGSTGSRTKEKTPTSFSWRSGKSALTSSKVKSSSPSSPTLTRSSFFSSSAAAASEATALNYDALIMLANSHIHEDMEKLSAADFCLEVSHLELGMQGKLGFETICKVPQDATFVFASTDGQAMERGDGDANNNHGAAANNNSNKKGVVVTLPSVRARNLLINDSRRGNRKGEVNHEGVKMLRKAFWAVQKCRIDHFGKDQSHRDWPKEMHRVVTQDEDPLERVHPRHSTVMWRLRDGFEKYQEHCHRRKEAIVDVAVPDEAAGFSRADNNKLHRMTRRHFNMYFGHLFTMSNKRDWTPVLHIRYMEIMIEALQRAQDSIMAELACLELWKEVSHDGDAVWGAGIARLGHALMGRVVRESEGLKELCNADMDGNGRMTGDEFIDFNCKRLISHLGEAEWGRVPGMLGLCAQRLRCETARNVPAFPIDSMVRTRRHIESVDTALEDLLEAENALDVVLKELYAEFDTSVGAWTEEEVAMKRRALAERCKQHGINWYDGDADYAYGDALFRELAQRELIFRGAQRRLRVL
jgi:hypothetical protein